MPGSTEKSRRYLGLTVEYKNRAGANDRALKLKFMQIAALTGTRPCKSTIPRSGVRKSH
jgi:hypothetical protein